MWLRTVAGITALLVVALPTLARAQAQGQDLATGVRDLTKAGVEARASDDLALAESRLREAVELARELPSSRWLERAEALKRLASLFPSDPAWNAQAEVLLSERSKVVRQSAPADPKVGRSLFDLQSVQAVLGKLDEAEVSASEAVEYYAGPCTTSIARDRCDRLLADVEALMGAAYFNSGGLEEAEVWLKKVIERPDDMVRPESMLMALRAYAMVHYRQLNLAIAVPIHRRALQFEERYPQAAQSIGQWHKAPALE